MQHSSVYCAALLADMLLLLLTLVEHMIEFGAGLSVQGDRERRLGLPVTPACDRDTVVVSTSQLRFIDMFLRPLLVQVRPHIPHKLLLCAAPLSSSPVVSNFRTFARRHSPPHSSCFMYECCASNLRRRRC